MQFITKIKEEYIEKNYHINNNYDSMYFYPHFNNYINSYYNKIIKKYNIKKLYFESFHNMCRSCYLSIKKESVFNKPINYLPSSLTHLNLGLHFNQPINNLPNNLEYLILEESNFNQPIDNLPNSLTHLLLGFNFNQPIDNKQISFSQKINL
jgi:hypothetical protein